jgi:hypothetical protein
MKVAWIYPHEERCGIALYAERYTAALEKLLTVVRIDSRSLLHGDAEDLFKKINECDVVHLQYETSFFMKGRADRFPAVCRRITRPLVTSLHEVYREFPDVFPRRLLRGSFVTLMLKRALYDYRHPAQSAFRRHLTRGFFARTILVHQEYHGRILQDLGIRGSAITVLPHPIPTPGDRISFPAILPDRTVHLAACGYINPHYDYDLLFYSLDRLALPWRFTWVGGLRRSEEEPLLMRIRTMVAERSWQDRFQITGWLPGVEHDLILSSADLFCALFKIRSSSGSITAAIGALCPIVATKLPLTAELADRHGIIHCTESTPDGVAEGIRSVLTSSLLRATLEKNMLAYRKQNTYDALAEELITVYRQAGAA